jgi:hypothetical protein
MPSPELCIRYLVGLAEIESDSNAGDEDDEELDDGM